MHDLHPADVPLRETLVFLDRALSPDATRVLEVGCGNGALARRLLARGLRVTGIDRASDSVAEALRAGFPAVEADFLSFQSEAFDAVLFSRSLHHIADLPAAVERAHSLLKPGGLLVAEEFAVEEIDEPSARWFYEIETVLEAAGLLSAREGNAPPERSYLDRWRAEHVRCGVLHEGQAMVRAVERHFEILESEVAPYLYRNWCDRLDPDELGHRVGQCIFELERARIDDGELGAAGLRLVARRMEISA